MTRKNSEHFFAYGRTLWRSNNTYVPLEDQFYYYYSYIFLLVNKMNNINFGF